MRMVSTCTFRCRPEILWEHLRRSELLKSWLPGLVEHELIDETPDGVGTRFRMVVKEGGKLQEYHGEVLECDEPRHLKSQMTGGCMKDTVSTSTFDLDDLGNETRLRQVVEANLSGWGFKLLSPVFLLLGKVWMRGTFRRLRRCVEMPTA